MHDHDIIIIIIESIYVEVEQFIKQFRDVTEENRDREEYLTAHQRMSGGNSQDIQLKALPPRDL